MADQNEFRGWARVEVMGHQTHIGFVTTEVYGAAVLFRIDQPALPECTETLEKPEYIGAVYARPGSVVTRGAVDAASVLIGAGSIYRIIPCDEAAAIRAIREAVRRPLHLVRLADEDRALAAAESEDCDEEEIL